MHCCGRGLPSHSPQHRVALRRSPARENPSAGTARFAGAEEKEGRRTRSRKRAARVAVCMLYLQVFSNVWTTFRSTECGGCFSIR